MYERKIQGRGNGLKKISDNNCFNEWVPEHRRLIEAALVPLEFKR